MNHVIGHKEQAFAYLDAPCEHSPAEYVTNNHYDQDGLVAAFALIDPDRAWIPQAWGWLPVVASTSVHPHFSQVTAERVNRWHAQGWEVAVWTVDDVDEARRLRALGVDWIITNRPGELRRQLKTVG